MKKQYRFLTACALMVMLLTGVMPRAMAQNLDGTDNGKLAEVHEGDRYDLVYGVSDGTADLQPGQLTIMLRLMTAQ